MGAQDGDLGPMEDILRHLDVERNRTFHVGFFGFQQDMKSESLDLLKMIIFFLFPMGKSPFRGICRGFFFLGGVPEANPRVLMGFKRDLLGDLQDYGYIYI